MVYILFVYIKVFVILSFTSKLIYSMFEINFIRLFSMKAFFNFGLNYFKPCWTFYF